ncbi:phosphoribosyltransferase [Salegentibacter chungangensis]|uniref:Phosphoribosyltransferase n=1 Tax=Salegentibacter chungangensis TaxID=1335724 RepID=A0ABW3NQ98_9FLAO
MFENRKQAGKQLAEALSKYKGKDAVVLAIPRGGLPLGAIIAKSLHAPLDVVLTKKIGHPGNKEYAIGAVSLEDIYLTGRGEASQEYIEKETERIRELLKTRDEHYHGKFRAKDLKGKVVIITDDGIATGSTILATVEFAAAKTPAAIVVAVPVAPPDSIENLWSNKNVDDVICLQTPYNFYAVGQFYKDFQAVSDEEAIRILEEANKD